VFLHLILSQLILSIHIFFYLDEDEAERGLSLAGLEQIVANASSPDPEIQLAAVHCPPV